MFMILVDTACNHRGPEHFRASSVRGNAHALVSAHFEMVWHIHIAFQQKLIRVKLLLPSESESPSIEGNQGIIPPFPHRFASGGLPPCLPLC
jgi:hypothetical protein